MTYLSLESIMKQFRKISSNLFFFDSFFKMDKYLYRCCLFLAPKQFQCIACTGKSEQDCLSRKRVVSCARGNRCYHLIATYRSNGKTIVYRGCTTLNTCSTYCSRYKSTFRYCKFSCCSTNKCNAGI